MRTANELFRKSQHTVKNYRTDFVHDFKTIKQYPGTPYLHATRLNGTAIMMMHSAKHILDECSQMTDGREHARQVENYIQWPKTLANHYIDSEECKLIHYFDGKKLTRIKKEKAFEILQNWQFHCRMDIDRIQKDKQRIESGEYYQEQKFSRFIETGNYY